MRKVTSVIGLLLLAGCTNTLDNLPVIKAYKLDIQQGNYVTPEMMMKLRPGMTPAQVRYVMGSPLIVDVFHRDRWDYLYRMQKGGNVIEQRHVSLYFQGGGLVRVQGDIVPAGSTLQDVTKKAAQEAPVPPVESATQSDGRGQNVHPETAPETEKQQAPKTELPTVKPATGPATQSAPLPAPTVENTQPKPEKKSWLDKLKFWKSSPPTPLPAPDKAPVAPKTSVPVPNQLDSTRQDKLELIRPVEAAKDIPSDAATTSQVGKEQEPGYFEKMLKEIGL